MSLFIHDLLAYRSLQCAVAAGIFAAIAAGVVGSLVVVRRSTYMAGSISHGVLAGLGLARFLQRACGVTWLSPMLGASIAAVLAALAIAFACHRGKARNDTVLSAIWSVGMAVGVSFMAATPGYQDDLMSYLFGSLALAGPAEVAWMGAVAAIVLAVSFLCFDRFLAIAFSAEMARLRGVSVLLYECIFLVLTALTVVMLVQVSGIILAIALLSLPAAAAGMLTSRLGRMMALATLIGILATLGGLAVSYGPGLPPGATTVEIVAGAYFAIAICRRLSRRGGGGNG